MTDEERLIEAVAKAWWSRSFSDDPQYARDSARNFVAAMREQKIGLTPPPAPEPTYTIRLTEKERNGLLIDVEYAESNYDTEIAKRLSREIAERLRALTPDEDTDGPDGR